MKEFDEFLIVEKSSGNIVKRLTEKEVGDNMKRLYDSGELGKKYIIEKFSFRHLDFNEKVISLLHDIENYKERFDNTDHGGRTMRDIYPLDRDRYEFVIELLKTHLR